MRRFHTISSKFKTYRLQRRLLIKSLVGTSKIKVPTEARVDS